ncbi:MAG: 50S ribosomal protein L25/general stress protein Ctc [Gammaproteobacteria bacterium]
MSNSFELQAEFREDLGKGASRRLRHAGKVPAVVYGGNADPRAITVSHQELLRQVENEAFFSNVITLKVGDIEQGAIVKDMQRHPAKKVIMHIDFQRIIAGEAIRMTVPLHFTGEETAPGAKLEGGVFSRLKNDVDIMCLPKDLPEFIEVNVAEMNLDDLLHLSDIALPEGVELPDLTHGDENDLAVVSLHRPQKVKVEDDEEATTEDGAAEGGDDAAEGGDAAE